MGIVLPALAAAVVAVVLLVAHAGLKFQWWYQGWRELQEFQPMLQKEVRYAALSEVQKGQRSRLPVLLRVRERDSRDTLLS